MNSKGDGKPEPVDPESVVRLLELELMQKRAARQMAGRRWSGLRAASFIFLFTVILGAYWGFNYVFTREVLLRSKRLTDRSRVPARPPSPASHDRGTTIAGLAYARYAYHRSFDGPD